MLKYKQYALLPVDFDIAGGPLGYFQLFFNEYIFQELAENTNQYADRRGAGNVTQRSRPWKPTSAAKLKIFFSIIIYMSVFPFSQVSDYWRHDNSFPSYRIGIYLSQNHFEQLKRYFHILPSYQSLL
ncbi:hypothetical protein C7212DRAFT_172436 [Tuber magnatum]|uniref:PiggyBac transposable element-derived protein domain-containing protein n=1 Tax=Tuber magnatum TaxID=42249 RepID=A0A317T114_9PEZI|nr:hypothetical protein C7212DRAFT_172436 [Tuber magnatum]